MKHLLLIEDNDEIRDNTAEILELAGYKVTTAENGKVGVEKPIKSGGIHGFGHVCFRSHS